MKKDHQIFVESVKSENIDLINDLLIEAGKKADRDFLACIDHLIETANKSILEKIKLNIIFILGEIGNINILDNKYLVYLIETYYDSDRWVRNEIVQALGKIVNRNKLSNEIFKVLAYAVIEDYNPTKINTLKVLKKIKQLPDFILKNLLKVIDNENLEVVEYSIQILKDHIKNDSTLFDILNSSENYKLLTKNSIRVLLIEYFDTLVKLKTFRERIEKTGWRETNKSLFFKEIDSFQRILTTRS